jgi:hypothetical protein
MREASPSVEHNLFHSPYASWQQRVGRHWCGGSQASGLLAVSGVEALIDWWDDKQYSGEGITP